MKLFSSPCGLQEAQNLNTNFAFYKDYYISFSKLSSLKRVAHTVEAFRDMPDKKLLVIYGQNDPQRDEIIALAKGHDNITFLTLADNNELPRYVA